MAVLRNADPATLFDAARSGDQIALPRLLSLVERGGDGARAVAEIAYRSPRQAYSVGILVWVLIILTSASWTSWALMFDR